jgi:hypothetical protein
VIVAAKDKAAVDRAWLDLAGLKALKQGADGIYVGGHVTPIAEGVMELNSQADTKKRRNVRAASTAQKLAR